MVLDSCWIFHSGYSDPAIQNDGNLLIEGSIFVLAQGLNAGWINNYANAGQCGLFIDGARFCVEHGGITFVYNYASHTTNLASNQALIISIKNCQLASAGLTIELKSTIVLFAVPNQVAMEDNFGFYNLIDGTISKDSTLDVGAVSS